MRSSRLLALAALVALSGCPKESAPAFDRLSSFDVKVTGVFQSVAGARSPLAVISVCAAKHGGDANVPAAERGTPDCRYAIPRGEIEIEFTAQALDLTGQRITDLSGPVSFRVVPGDLSGDYDFRWSPMTNGVLTGKVKSVHQYGKARVWVEDAPPKLFYDGGIVGGSVGLLPQEPPRRTYATGMSQVVNFDEPTLQSLQLPDGFDNRSSPLVGEYVVVGKDPSSGERFVQSCVSDPRRNGQPVGMVVTGIEPSGFYVADVTACRLQEWTTDPAGVSQVRTSEPPEPCLATLASDGGTVPVERTDGGSGTCEVSQKACRRASECPSYLPGHFGQMFIYNYSYPDGLSQGDLLYTLSGAVQEFTSTTQITFPGWIIGESVRTLPPDQWNKWLDFVPVRELNLRICGADNTAAPFLTDQLCGHNKRNLKMESLESALVKVRNVRFPDTFKNCDFNSDSSVAFFCEQKPASAWLWGTCSLDAPEAAVDQAERECNQGCVIATGENDGKICAEESTYIGFGQFPVEMNPPGPASLGFDESLPARIQKVAVASGTSARLTGYGTGQQLNVVCDVPVRWRTGDGTEEVASTDPLLAAKTPARPILGAGEVSVSVQADAAAGTCYTAINPKTRINLVTKDALPELQPDCKPDDANAEKASQCKLLRAATYEITGHLKQVQPARPRWLINPRDPDDVCCHPGPGLECPKPIKPCK